MGLLREGAATAAGPKKRHFNRRLVARVKGVVMRTLGYDVYSSHSHLRGNYSMTTLDIELTKNKEFLWPYRGTMHWAL